METVALTVLLVVLGTATWLCGMRAVDERGERAAWIAMTLAVLFWTIGTLARVAFYGVTEARPSPTVPDVFFLAFYPAALVALALMIRNRVDHTSRGVWLDTLSGTLAVVAVGVAVLAPAITVDPDAPAIETIILFAYPVGDLLLLSTVLAALVAMRFRNSGPWFPLAIGLGLVGIADILWAVLSAQGVTALAELTLLWIPGFLAIAIATGRHDPGGQEIATRGWSQLAIPLSCSAVAVGLLAADMFLDTLPLSSEILALTILVVAIVRMALIFDENIHLLGARREAITDHVTGLANRRHLARTLDRAADNWQRRGIGCGLLFIDLDHFKDLNVTLGHSAGDRVLGILGPRLRNAIDEDHLVAGLGGDEFAVFLNDDPTEDDLVRLAGRVRTEIEKPIEVDGLRLRLQSSVGGALLPGSTEDAPALMRCADMAMYEAKRQRTGYQTYSQDRDEHSRDRLGLAGELREAIGTSELVVHFQPKLHLDSGRIDGVEALVRWEHPRLGMLLPFEFLPIAEQVGLMGAITNQVLMVALEQVGTWRAEGRDIGMAINLSVGDLNDNELPNRVRSALAATGVEPEALTLELTEDMVVSNSEVVLEILGQLRRMGVSLSLDDFGAGASSLAYLHRLPITQLKLDRSFVIRLDTDPVEAVVIRSTIDLCKQLGLEVVAEGVETHEALDRLASFGCDYAQAWLIAVPQSADNLATWLDTRVPGPPGPLPQPS